MYNKILVTIDLSEAASWRKALPTAIELCRSFGAELHVLNVLPDIGSSVVQSYFPAGFEEKAREGTEEALQKVIRENVPDDLPAQLHLATGTIYKEILDAAKNNGVDLIVMASHRPDLSDYLLGPNAARVVRHADCSVMVVRD